MVMAPDTTKPRVEGDQGGRRQQRVGHGVPPAHRDVAQPLGPRGGQVVLAQLVEQRRPHDQRVLGEVGQRQRDDRQGQVPRQVQNPPSIEVRRPRERSGCRSGRSRGTGRCRRRGWRSAAGRATTPASSTVIRPTRWYPVEPAVALPAPPDPDADADHRRHAGRRADQDDRRPQPVEDEVSHRHPVLVRQTELAGERVPQVGQELLPERLVQAERPGARRCSWLSSRLRPSVRTGSPGSTRNRKKLNTRTKTSAPIAPSSLPRRSAPVDRRLATGAAGVSRAGDSPPPPGI